MSQEQSYLDLLKQIMENGTERQTRNGKTRSLFAKQIEFTVSETHFPLLTTKKMFFKGVVEELLFFMRGETNSKLLEEKGVNIWKANTSREFLDANGFTDYEEGDMGSMYFYQLLHFGKPYHSLENETNNNMKYPNQLQDVIDLLITDRFSRRMIMTTFNPQQVKEGVLYPCHGIVIQFGVEGTNKLCCSMYQRSSDCFLGLPFNIASYSLLLLFICNIVNSNLPENDEPFVPHKLVISLGDCHIYEEHYSAVMEQLTRSPNAFPHITFTSLPTTLSDFKTYSASEIQLSNYLSYPPIKAKMIA